MEQQGLIDKEMPADAAPPGADAAADTDGFTPEQQEQYETAVAVGMQIIFSKGGVDRVLQVLKSQGGSVPQKVADLAFTYVTEIDSRMDLNEEVIVPAGVEIAGEVFEVAVRSRMIANDEQTKQAVVSMVIAKLFDHYEVTPEDAAEAEASLSPDIMQQASQQSPMGETAADPMQAQMAEPEMPQ